MNTAIFASLLVVATLLAANLVFTYGVTRRLQDHELKLAELRSGEGEGSGLPPALPAVGTKLPDFEETSVDGRPVSSTQYQGGPSYIGFFTPRCVPCQDRLPEFDELVQSLPPSQALVVIRGSRDDADQMMKGLGSGVTVVVDDEPSALNAAFGVDRYPTLLVVADGSVELNTSVIGPVRAAVQQRSRGSGAMPNRRTPVA